MLSVVIASSKDERRLVHTLAALVPAAASGAVVEAIVVDPLGQAGVRDVADHAGCRLVQRAGTPGELMAEAAASAKAPWLLLMPAGLVVEEGAEKVVSAFISTRERAGAVEDVAATFRQVVGGFEDPATLAGGALRVWRDLVPRISPAGGLVLHRRLLAKAGGLRAAAKDPLGDLMGRLGRRRIVVLRARASFD